MINSGTRRPRLEGPTVALAPGASILLLGTPGGSHGWDPATYVGNMHKDSGSWLWPGVVRLVLVFGEDISG